MSTHVLAALQALRGRFGADDAARKRALLGRLAAARLGSASAVRRLHELLCWMRAYPDDAAVQAQVEAMLAGFAQRPDLRAHRAALADSGIAGTPIRDRFFAAQAQWLAAHWPAQLRLDRALDGADARLAQALPALLTHVETQALAELKPGGFAALDRLRGTRETDAVFLLRRIAAMPGDGITRERFSDALDAGYVLEPGPGTPSRTAACLPGAPVVHRRAPPPHARPALRAELLRPPRRVRRLPHARAEQALALARAAMVTRARSLEAFSFGDPRDAWWVDDGDGLAFVILGVVPERRHAVASWYGGLTLRNGVPIGYLQSDHVGRSAALSFNTFDTFRGGEAAYTFARWLAALHALLGTTSFSVEPYQLGAHGNDEGLLSGAWWFYAKLGFAPRDAGAQALALAEAARLARRPGHRSTPAVLARLAAHHLFFDLDPARPHPLLPTGALGLAAGAALSACHGADRERALDELVAAQMRLAGLAALRGWSADERRAWRHMAPVLALLGPGRWPDAARRALAEVVRAKGGRSERDYVARLLAHRPLHGALLRWAARAAGGGGTRA